MNIKKPNSFARYGNDYVAPLTTIDQIVKPSGERYTNREFELMSNVENVMFGENGCGKNLLNPTLQTTTSNGVTCTNNGDGTYTLNGTASSSDGYVSFTLERAKRSGTVKLIGLPFEGSQSTIAFSGTGIGYVAKDTIFTLNNEEFNPTILVYNGYTCNNVVIKPMLTTDLSVTYDDFEPYVKSLKQLTNNMDLLWENASPTSDFSSQTISLDLSSYTTFIIFFNLAVAGSDWASLMDKIYCCIFVKGKDSNTYAGAYKDYFMWRMISSNDNSITFGNSYYERGTDVVNNPNILVPLEIYGVK